jgi:hypothetical protein
MVKGREVGVGKGEMKDIPTLHTEEDDIYDLIN